MEKSKIKNQKSKIHIKKQIFLVFNASLLLLALPLSVFAHEAEVPHEEPVFTVGPLLFVGLVAVLAVGGFLLWKFVLSSPKSTSPTQPNPSEKTPPAQEKAVSKSGKEASS